MKRILLGAACCALLVGCGDDADKEKEAASNTGANWPFVSADADDSDAPPLATAEPLLFDPATGKVMNEEPEPQQVQEAERIAEENLVPEPVDVPALLEQIVPVANPEPLKKPVENVAGMTWHISLPATLQAANAFPGQEKPVMFFRVLGELSGFM